MKATTYTNLYYFMIWVKRKWEYTQWQISVSLFLGMKISWKTLRYELHYLNLTLISFSWKKITIWAKKWLYVCNLHFKLYSDKSEVLHFPTFGWIPVWDFFPWIWTWHLHSWIWIWIWSNGFALHSSGLTQTVENLDRLNTTLKLKTRSLMW